MFLQILSSLIIIGPFFITIAYCAVLCAPPRTWKLMETPKGRLHVENSKAAEKKTSWIDYT